MSMDRSEQIEEAYLAHLEDISGVNDPEPTDDDEEYPVKPGFCALCGEDGGEMVSGVHRGCC